MAKRKIVMIYGEKTIQINRRVPESRRKEIEKLFDDILASYRNPTEVEIEVLESKQKNNDIASMKPVEKKSNPSDIRYPETTDEGYDGKKLKPSLSDEVGQYVKPSEIKFEKIASLPLGTELLESFGSKGALRSLNDEEYFTKRTHNGKLEILKHENYESAVKYANDNFK